MTATRPAKKAPAKKAGAAAVESFEQKKERKRAEARERAEKRRKSLEGNMAASGRLQGRPSLHVRPVWELSERELSRFDLVHGVTHMLDQVRHKVHPVDHDLVFNALGAAVGFHELSKLIDSMEWDGSEDDLTSDLEHIRVGFELALQALDRILVDRGIVLDSRSKGGKNKSVPAWHSECIRLARAYLDAGTEKHELVGKLSIRINRDRTTIARVLKKAGVK